MDIDFSKSDQINSWPFQEARLIAKKINKKPEKGYILFQSGYGASGLPHIGTFGEVSRTQMIMNVFNKISDIPTKLITFSDDYDALRKVPENLPNQKMLKENLGKPVSSIPDPFGKYETFADNVNNKLKTFLDTFEIKFELKSATELYKSGFFDKYLLKVLKNCKKITEIVLPTIGLERRSTYSPILPISQKTGKVLQVPIKIEDEEKGEISFTDEDGKNYKTTVLKGNCKLQWKVDWAMRWDALDVDYELYGKDLVDSIRSTTQICKLLGKSPPLGFNYELFLDEKGEKISKKKGNGITIEEWIKYGPSESLLLFMYYTPKKAKRLYYDVIPKHVDEYLKHLRQFKNQNDIEKLNNPVIHIHKDKIPKAEIDISFSLILNLVSVCQSDDKNIIWNYIKEYMQDAKPSDNYYTDKLVEFSIQYYKDFVKPNKKYKKPSEEEKKILQELIKFLKKCKPKITSEEIQNEIYELGKKYKYELKDWFLFLYETLLGQKNGPRLGTFILLLSIKETIKLIEDSFSR
jgi:lysyl-tRNA synthetase class 1